MALTTLKPRIKTLGGKLPKKVITLAISHTTRRINGLAYNKQAV